MIRTKKYILLIALIVLTVVCGCLLRSGEPEIENVADVDRLPVLEPDITDIVIPPNIAPLNFKIMDKAGQYYVKLHAEDGAPITWHSRNNKVIFPIQKWAELLTENRGREITIDVYCKDENDLWSRYKPVTLQVAQENIDDYLVYRIIHPAYRVWSNIGIYQRNLGTFEEKVILHNKTLDNACLNCHSFHQNNPQEMMLHLRGGPGTALLLAQNGVLKNINTRTTFNASPAAYRDWHPNGKIIAFSVNKVAQFFHTVGETRDVYDTASDIVLYQIESNTITSAPQVSLPNQMETYPAWSPDGRYLYFCRAPQPVVPEGQNFPYNSVFYELMRISYNADTNEWGEPEMLLPHAVTGGSITHPKISPDGRYVLYCLCRYGNFSIYRPESDLYLLDLESGENRRLSVNSERTESYHSWSGNGRWIVFSSKRQDGIMARPFFSYFDSDGEAHKPFMLPQEDPGFYDTFLKTYNLPEFVAGPITATPQQLTRLAFAVDKVKNAALDPRLSQHIDTPDASSPWQSAPRAK
ncbi:MAG TPA: cytochrome C biosynthesis protein [bacterium]|nr:cytochrome C biosynthesis protein [bacterium]HPN45942.1 cytochrome C biosynthesis protein [bacterium]